MHKMHSRNKALLDRAQKNFRFLISGCSSLFVRLYLFLSYIFHSGPIRMRKLVFQRVFVLRNITRDFRSARRIYCFRRCVYYVLSSSDSDLKLLLYYRYILNCIFIICIFCPPWTNPIESCDKFIDFHIELFIQSESIFDIHILLRYKSEFFVIQNLMKLYLMRDRVPRDILNIKIFSSRETIQK